MDKEGCLVQRAEYGKAPRGLSRAPRDWPSRYTACCLALHPETDDMTMISQRPLSLAQLFVGNDNIANAKTSVLHPDIPPWHPPIEISFSE